MPDVGGGAESKDRREGQEKKPDDFIPQGVKGFDDGGHDVFEKRARLGENLLPHHFIVTGGRGGGLGLPLHFDSRKRDGVL